MTKIFFFRASRFLGYCLNSQSGKGHGIHSPFVFDLVSRVFRNKSARDVVLMIEKNRKMNLADRRTITVKDLGAGSEKMKSNQRKVSDMARYSAVPPKYGRLLMNLASEFGRNEIIEFGTSLGISTMYMAAGRPDALVYTMEGCPATAEIAEENFSASGLGNIKLLKGSFENLMAGFSETPGMVFIDGNHKKDPVIRYFRKMTEIADEETVIVIDDIHLSEEMEEAWDEVKGSDGVSFTIDISRMGLVFFRKGMTHFDYVIRY